jgi:hypothetical protein
MRLARFATLVAAGAVLALVACNGDNAIGPNEFQVSNTPDDFSWQAGNLNNVTQRFTYTWQNSGTVATVNQTSAITAGTVTLTIKDASDIQVYAADQKNGGAFDTLLGTTGPWTIQLFISGASGTVSFGVQKKP